MNTDDRLLQILDESACLSQSQLERYMNQTLFPEELRAVEMHLCSCPLCNDAVEGFEAKQNVGSILATLVMPKLPNLPVKEKVKEKKEPAPQNKPPESKPEPIAKPMVVVGEDFSLATNAPESGTVDIKRKRRGLGIPLGIAATLVTVSFALWYYKFREPESVAIVAAETATDDASKRAQPTADTEQIPGASAPIAGVDATAQQQDSLLLAKEAEAKRKARRDSLNLIAAAKKHREDSLRSQQLTLAATTRNETEDRAVEAAPAPKQAASRPIEDKPAEASDYDKGVKAFKEKNYSAALQFFSDINKDHVRYWDAVYYTGMCNRYLDKNRKARKAFERVVKAKVPQSRAAQKQLDQMKDASDD